MVGYDVDQVLEQYRFVNLILQFIGAVLVILSIGIGVLLSRIIREPVDTLINGTILVRDGDFSVTIPESKRNDELDILARNFNDMVSKLNHYYSELINEIQIRKEVEAQLRENIVLLNRSNQDLRQFAFAASHDLQEPLRAIAGFLQLLERQYFDTVDDKGRDYIQRSVSAAKRLQTIINDLLYYSEIQRDSRKLAYCNIQEIIDRVIVEYSNYIHETGAEIQVGDMPIVIADPEHMYTVFYHIIGNSLKFSTKNRTPRILIDSEKKDRNLQLFSVRDNGIGIPKKYFAKIFEIFQRLHPRSTYEGNGIGLTICEKIVTLYGGSIWVESEPDKGSTFYFTIPETEE
jgi:light-regulated signal transduction histidine kinase (bacteriophytochrome)